MPDVDILIIKGKHRAFLVGKSVVGRRWMENNKILNQMDIFTTRRKETMIGVSVRAVDILLEDIIRIGLSVEIK